MIKCKNNGKFTCIGKNGKPKNRYETADLAILSAKRINTKYPDNPTKLVSYKCSHCHFYHLTSKPKRVRNYA